MFGHRVAYREAGDDSKPTVLFLHGNPTSSFIWRNIIPHVAPVAHCIAPDLIGFGDSDKPDISYRFQDHALYLDEFLDSLGIDSAYLVAQDWGTALAFHLSARKPAFARGLAFMEFIRPMPSWDHFHQAPQARALFQQFRTPDVGEKLVLEDNLFIERILPGSIKRKLDDEEMAAYRRPFQTMESRRPVLQFPRELPIARTPADVYTALEEAHAALRTSHFPKLLFVGNPGALVSPEFARNFASTLNDCECVELGSGLHYLQEDHPETIGREVARWIARHEALRNRRDLSADAAARQ